MPTNILHLPGPLAGTKKHLFELVTKTTYRDNARHEKYGFVPQGDRQLGKIGKGAGTKYGWDDTLPSGTNNRREGDKDPGKYRFYRLVAAHDRHTWWYLDHIGYNQYLFFLIAIPKCSGCKGTNSIVCPFCKGAGRVYVAGEPVTACLTCRAERDATKRGFITCPDCGTDPVIVDGYSVEKSFAKW